MPAPLPSHLLAPACSALAARLNAAPEVALVLGSGLGALGDRIENAISVAYDELPGMPTSAVVGHAGRFLSGILAGRRVIAMQGRVHLYEGYNADEVVFGVRLMLRLGARTLIVSNAAGGIRANLQPGSLMLIEDHLNLTGHNCLRGPNDPALGVRFPDMSAAYDPELIACAQRVATHNGLPVTRGVYAGLLGPNYETPAEIRMLRSMGADAVGMSTVLEVIAARHMGARVLGLSCVTNLAAGLSAHPLDHAEVEQTAEASRAQFSRLVEGVLTELPT
jgi:purine-nucleoside phosphorylase